METINASAVMVSTPTLALASSDLLASRRSVAFNSFAGLSSMPCIRSRSVHFQPIRAHRDPKLNGESSTGGITEKAKLAGQVAIITGGASGIGAETAHVFVQQGAHVFILDIQDPSNAGNLLKDLGDQASYIQCNVTREEEVEAAWDKAYALKKRLDIVFANAGATGPWGPIDELNIKDFDSLMGLNLRAVVLGIKHSARLMKPAKCGSILCSSSAASILAGIGPLSYTVSKNGVVALVKCAAAELAEYGIRVNALSFGAVATPLIASTMESLTGQEFSKDQVEQAVAANSLLPGKSLTTVDAANTALFLASNMGGFISGHNLVLDAGYTVAKSVPGFAWTTSK